MGATMRKLNLTFVALVITASAVLFVASPLTGGAGAETQPSTTTTAVAPAPTTTTTIVNGVGYTAADLVRIEAWVAAVKRHQIEQWVAAVKRHQIRQWVEAVNRYNFNKWMAWALAKERAAAAARPQPGPGGLIMGRKSCGGDLPPCYVMLRESKGYINIWNGGCTWQCGISSASGKWQFVRGTWNGYGGYRNAADAPESVQDAKARQLWAGGRGCGHWAAC